jgi:hypothetical protein
VSRPPFIGQERERRGHGRVETACNEGAVKLPLSLGLLLLMGFDWWRDGQTLLDDL